MSTSAVSGARGQVGSQAPNHDAFDSMDLQKFISLLVTEMQNQDPMNPMDNSQILQQISQIKAIASNQKLSDTLGSMQVQQNMTSASMLLDRNVTGLDAKGYKVTGVVDRVSVADGKVQLYIGDQSLELKNVSEIIPKKA